MTHNAIVVEVVVAGNLPHMLMYLWLYQLVLTLAAIYLHDQFLLGLGGTTLATVRLYVLGVVNFAVL